MTCRFSFSMRYSLMLAPLWFEAPDRASRVQMPLAFELHRHVMDSHLTHEVTSSLQHVLLKLRLANDGVGAERHHPGRHRPDVQVVHGFHPWDALQRGPDVGERDV